MNKYVLISSVIVIPVIIIGLLIWGNTGTSQNEILKRVQDDNIKVQDDKIAEQQEVISATITPMSKQNTNTQPDTKTFEKKKYVVNMTTSEGKITLELNGDTTPITINNFVTLAKKGFYDNTIFHRTIPNFMIQGGDPTGTGSGGPGYRFADEPFTGEYTRGTIAMANAGPDTNGSQFFIMHADYALPKDYVIFGKVTSGIEAVDKIATAPTMQDGRENSKPQNPAKIVKIEVVEK